MESTFSSSFKCALSSSLSDSNYDTAGLTGPEKNK